MNPDVIRLSETMSYVIVAILFCTLWCAANVSERNAIERRSDRLSVRQSVRIDQRTDSIPSVDQETLETILSLIGNQLGVPFQYLRPSDSFDGELNLKDRFWCLIADDDSRETVADIFDEQYNVRPSGNWADLRDVVIETAPIVQKTTDNNAMDPSRISRRF